jgi:hypothetical protein
MPLTKLQFRPGIVRDLTSYSNEGGWRDGDKVRFRLGYPEKMGGWAKYSSSTFLGTCRALHNWIALDGSNFLGLGTHLKYYIEEGGTYNDITPLRATTAAGDVTFAATNGSSVITVSDTNHGAVLGDFVTFSGAVGLGGNVLAAVLNTQHEVTSVTNNNVYEITVSVTANASDTGNGGPSVVGAYQINIGLNSQIGGTGWGAGTWSRGTWGSASPGGRFAFGHMTTLVKTCLSTHETPVSTTGTKVRGPRPEQLSYLQSAAARQVYQQSVNRLWFLIVIATFWLLVVMLSVLTLGQLKVTVHKTLFLSVFLVRKTLLIGGLWRPTQRVTCG